MLQVTASPPLSTSTIRTVAYKYKYLLPGTGDVPGTYS